MGKKTTLPGPTMVGIGVLVAFDGFRAGETYVVERDAVVEGWLALGLVEVLHTVETELEVSFDGATEVGSGGPVEDVLGDEPE